MIWRRALVAVALLASAALAPAAGVLDFSAAERALIASHGPWPLPPAHDAGNPVAGQPAAIAVGKRLFFERRLSADGSLSCASCHVPALAFADGRKRSKGREILDRNAPSLLNAGHQRWLGWDGAADSLWSQAIRVMLDRREFANSAGGLHALVQGDAALACDLRQAFGETSQSTKSPEDPESPDRTLVQLAQAIGAYVASLQSPRTPFDAVRDALDAGDAAAAARYPLAAQRGLRIFIGKGRCQLCHSGAMFTNGEFADIGVPFFVRPGVVDPGRHGGIAALKGSRYNLLGPWATLLDPAEATKTRHVAAEPRHFGEFKVPGLRHVAATAPYMHDGSLATLADVVGHYDRIDLERLHADGERILVPLQLTPAERADLLAFLDSLGGPVVAPAGLGTDRPDACRKAGVATARSGPSRTESGVLPRRPAP